MSWHRIHDEWPKHWRKIWARWGSLTPIDLDRIDGDRAELIAALEQRSGQPSATIEREVTEFEVQLFGHTVNA